MNEMNYRYIPHTLLRFEVQVAEHCNLNCCNCMHYSPVATPEFLDLEEYERDIRKLSELFDGEVEWIRLMGGEPLLHPSINDIISISRRYFPYGHIRIVTNGILLCKQTDEFWDLCNKNKIEIWVTKYPIDMDYKGIEKLVRSKGLVYGFYGEGENRRPSMWRFMIDPRGDFDPDVNFYNCRSANGCLTLKHGKMYTCAPTSHFHHLKEYLDMDIALSDRNGIDIHTANSPMDIMKHMVLPIPFCRYCDHTRCDDYEDDWCISSKDRYEWIEFVFSDEDMEYLKGYREVYVYGAGKWGGQTVRKLLKSGVKVKRILVSDTESNADSVAGIDVCSIKSIDASQKDGVCLIAIDGSIKKDIQHILRSKGFAHIIPVMREPAKY